MKTSGAGRVSFWINETVVLSPTLVIWVSRTSVRAEASKADLTGLQVKAGNKK